MQANSIKGGLTDDPLKAQADLHQLDGHDPGLCARDMRRAVLLAWLAAILTVAPLPLDGGSRADAPATVDLTKWTAPDIAAVGDDPFGQRVKYGYALFTDTANEIGPMVADPARRFTGNNLACQNCHLQGGAQPYAMPLVGVWGQFPQYRAREGRVATLQDRVNGCMERSMNGRALPAESREMQALSAYLRWLSTGIPSGAKLVGAGTLPVKEPARAADLVYGATVYARVCAQCHGANGLGQRAQSGAGYQFPPLWGSDSYNNGAGMDRLLTTAAFVLRNMPVGTTFDAPMLTDNEAYDVAGYMSSQPRPQKAGLENDFPIRSQKPIDTPYGYYADDFSAEQHKYGPFDPIRASLRELATEGRPTDCENKSWRSCPTTP
jgi:thiosulfate dehydrogenase